MKIENTHAFWENYIKNHPDRRYIEDNFDIHYNSYGETAPYKDGWVAYYTWSTIIFYKYDPSVPGARDKSDAWHRLDGPAYISSITRQESVYYLHGLEFSFDQWKNHPEVKNHCFEKCLRDILKDDEQ